MIRWCCYCQQLIGEAPPLLAFDMSHGICARCDARLEAGEELLAEYRAARSFYNALFAAARAGDRGACVAMVARAKAEGLGITELLVGVLQPALTEAGRRWELGEFTVADEHRFTSWCENMLALLDGGGAPPSESLDILLVVAPGNHHVVGPRIAEQVLKEAGVKALCVVPELPLSEVRRLAAERHAPWIGFSCALPHMVEAALEAARQLVAGGYGGRFMLSGQALRRSPELGQGAPATVCLTVEEASRAILTR